MSEWKEYKLGDLCEIKGGKRLPLGHELVTEKTKHPYIKARDIKNGKISTENLEFVTENTHDLISRYIVRQNDVCVTIVANIGDVGIVPKELDYANLTENAIRLTSFKNSVNSKYLNYLLSSDTYKKYCEGLAAGAAQAKMGIYKIKTINIKLPPLPIQNRIASILSAYDDLIENNNRRIALLEQMAEQIYKEWFVRMRFPGFENSEFEKGVPKGWDVKKINKIVTTQYGYTASADYETEGPKFLRITDIASSNIDWANVPHCPINENEINKYKLNFGDIVVARTGATAGYAKRIHKLHPTSVFASYLVRLKLIDMRLNYYIGLIVESNSYKDFVMSIAGGAAQPQANANVLTEMSVFIPDMSTIERFNKIVEPIFDEKEILIQQTQTLKQTRDLLLPRLISGKLQVKEAEMELENI